MAELNVVVPIRYWRQCIALSGQLVHTSQPTYEVDEMNLKKENNSMMIENTSSLNDVKVCTTIKNMRDN